MQTVGYINTNKGLLHDPKWDARDTIDITGHQACQLHWKVHLWPQCWHDAHSNVTVTCTQRHTAMYRTVNERNITECRTYRSDCAKTLFWTRIFTHAQWEDSVGSQTAFCCRHERSDAQLAAVTALLACRYQITRSLVKSTSVRVVKAYGAWRWGSICSESRNRMAVIGWTLTPGAG